jgi:molybdate/tungstate transport system substrate-binding protein
MKNRFIFFFILLFLASACRNSDSNKQREIIIFHAGSLSVPFNELKQIYEKQNPRVRVLLEPAGSLVCARKITELKKPCDIMASADYFVINQLLIPEYTDWSIRFATNEIVIAYTEKAAYSGEITSDNWMDILQKDDVIYGRADQDNDPCGYRTIMTFLLAEKYYNRKAIAESFITKNKDYVRPKEVDLIALMEANAIDYMFQYKSVAIQHGLKFVELPDEINLGNPSMAQLYGTVNVDVTGDKPGTRMRVIGEFINYSLTILKDAPNRKDAIAFISFILSKEGMDVFRNNGQEPVIPFYTDQPEKIPSGLHNFFSENTKN